MASRPPDGRRGPKGRCSIPQPFRERLLRWATTLRHRAPGVGLARALRFRPVDHRPRACACRPRRTRAPPSQASREARQNPRHAHRFGRRELHGPPHRQREQRGSYRRASGPFRCERWRALRRRNRVRPRAPRWRRLFRRRPARALHAMALASLSHRRPRPSFRATFLRRSIRTSSRSQRHSC